MGLEFDTSTFVPSGYNLVISLLWKIASVYVRDTGEFLFVTFTMKTVTCWTCLQIEMNTWVYLD